MALFDDYDDLVAAIEELELAGFDRAQINLMRSCRSAERKLGTRSRTSGSSRTSQRSHWGWVDRYELTEGKAALAAGLAYVGSLVAIGAVVAGGGELAAIIAAAAEPAARQAHSAYG